MSGIKQRDKKTKITREEILKRENDCEQFPAFSFRHLTANKAYNFEYFKKSQNERSAMLEALAVRIAEITSKSYEHWFSLPKKTGCETMPYWQFKEIKPNAINISKDDKVYVFRFNHQEYRILGIRNGKCPTLQVIGFDFDHSAYKH